MKHCTIYEVVISSPHSGDETVYFASKQEAIEEAEGAAADGLAATVHKLRVGPVNAAMVAVMLNGDGGWQLSSEFVDRFCEG